MNSWDPCCGVSLKRGAKVIAMIDMVTSVATGCFLSFALILTLFYGAEIKDALDKDKAEFPDEAQAYDYIGSGAISFLLLMTIVSSILYFLLAQSLLHGAKQKDISKVSRWINITTGLLFMRIFLAMFGAISMKESGALLFAGTINIMYTFYCLWVVYRFRNELATDESFVLSRWDKNPPVYKL